MNPEIFFIYDSHCPWSYAALPLVNEIDRSFSDIKINLLHCARYEGDENISKRSIELVEQDSNVTFSDNYLAQLSQAKDSTLIANILSWVENKLPEQTLVLLNNLMDKHFQQGNELTTIDDIAEFIEQYKLSPPAKTLTNQKITKNAEFIIHEIMEIQEIISTPAIPALLLAIDENLILLNHNLYLKNPTAIVEAIKLELDK